MKSVHIIGAAFAVPCFLATLVAGDIIDEFLAAEPIHPMVRINEDVFADSSDDRKREDVHNFTIEFKGSDFCSMNMTNLKVGDTGSIVTPYYPKSYPGRTECEWNLESENGTVIEATIFDLLTQPWFFTYFDYVMISKTGDYQKVEKLAGDWNGYTPMQYESDGNKLGIRFRSSTLFNFRGMKLHYVVKPANKDIKETQLENAPFDGHCGQSNLINNNNEEIDDKIIGPGIAARGSFPWMAALLIDGRSFCGGSIISKRHILTAAHCTDGARRITVLLGAENIKDKGNPNRQLFNVSGHDIYQHVNYNTITISNDIAILHLDREIKYNDYVKPICLPNKFFLGETFVGDEVRASGWGKSNDWAKHISTDLKNTTLKVMTNSRCKRHFRGLISGNLICTSTRWNASPCRGDSGGPLVVKQKNSFGKEYFMQVGLVSFGGSSCQRGYPVGFTRITAYLDFIQEQLARQY